MLGRVLTASIALAAVASCVGCAGDEAPPGEVAIELGTVKSRLFRAREALRREIENQSSDPSAL